MTESNHSTFEHPEVQLAGTGYVAAYVAGIALMGLSLMLVKDHALDPTALGIAISGIAGLAALLQCVLLLHMTLSRTQIWQTVALVLFVPLFILTIGLTSWMFHGLYQRTMLRPIAASQAMAPAPLRAPR